MPTSTINPMMETPTTESIAIVTSSTEPEVSTKKKVCFSSFASPFFFGPYGNQMYHLLTKFINDDQYEMYYLLLIDGLDDKMYTMEEVYNMDLENELKEKMPSYVQLDLLKSLKFIGGIIKSPVNGTILSSNIIPLTHSLCWIMTLPEQCQQCLKACYRGIKNNKYYLAMPGSTRTNFLVSWVWGGSTCISHGCGIHTLCFPEFTFSSPEAAHTKNACLKVGRKRWIEWCPVDEMALGNGYSL